MTQKELTNVVYRFWLWSCVGELFFIVLNAARIEINVASPSTFSRTFAEKKPHPIECMKN